MTTTSDLAGEPTYRKFLPADTPVQYLDEAGELTDSHARYPHPDDDLAHSFDTTGASR